MRSTAAASLAFAYALSHGVKADILVRHEGDIGAVAAACDPLV